MKKTTKQDTLNSVKEIDMSKYVDLPNPGLRAYFQHVVDGQPDDYRTPFYKGKSPQEICDLWELQLATIKDEWPSLWEFESDKRKKVGPMSVMKPLSERVDDISAYYDLVLLDHTPVPDSAINAVLAEWSGVKGLRIRSQENTAKNMKKSTNSGTPYFTRRSRVLDSTLPCSIVMDNDNPVVIQDGQRWDSTAILGWRGQEGGPNKDDVKQRVVWMMMFAINIKELQVYQPLIEAAQKQKLVPAWISMEAVDEGITRLFDSKDPNDDVIVTDFSKFDQHFNRACQDGAQTILTNLLTPSEEVNDWLTNVYPAKYYIPLMYDWGKVRTGHHGMASGSGGTNADETLLHRALQHEAAINAGQVLNPNSQCLGDDGILTYPGCTVKDVMSTYTAHGLEMNETKQYVSKRDCVYLQRWHSTDYRVNNVCVGVYSTFRALGRLASQERYYDPDVWGPKMVALRQLSILENVKYHPLREQFADFCMKGDKYRLGIDIPGFLDNITAEAQKAMEYMPDFLGYTKSIQKEVTSEATGIASWWIVNYLKSKA